MSSQKRKNTAVADASKKAKTDGSIMSFFGPPKTTTAPGSSTSTAPASVMNFDKAAWVGKLSAEQKKHLALEINTLDPSWLVLLKDEIVKPEFIALKKFIEAEVRGGKDVFPPGEDVYSWYV
jgi:uracil-DNA glycosylase